MPNPGNSGLGLFPGCCVPFAVGLSYLPGRDLDRASMVMGYFFCLSAAFVLARYMRDQEKSPAGGEGHADVQAGGLGWVFPCHVPTGRGLRLMEVHKTYKAFLGVSRLYLITGTLTLAKILRD